MTCLPLEFINGWLFGIQSGRLAYHDQIMSADSPAGRAYQVATVLADLARQKWSMEQRIESFEHLA